MVFNIVKKEYWLFILSGLLIIIINRFIPQILPEFLTASILLPTWAFLVTVIIGFGAIIFLLWTYKKKGIQSPLPNFLSYLFMSFVFSFFWVNNGWIKNPKAIIHAAYIIFFGFLYIMPREKNPVFWHILIPSMLIIDFYGYGALFGSDLLVVKFIPVLVLFVITYCYQKTKSWYAMTTFVLIVTLILILSLQATGYEGSTFTFTPQEGGPTFSSFMETAFGKTKDVIASQLDVATGGLFRGIVEKNQYESLGVYFANVKPADPRFYNDEPVTIWGTIRSKTYQEPVIVNFKCFRWKDNKRIPAEKYMPDTFPVFQLEESDVECTFQQKEGSQLDLGYNTIIFSAEYNFATNAYQKAYFIDRERYRAMVRENLDPFTEFGIKDKKPASVSTNGPVEIGINMQPLTGVSSTYQVAPTLGVSLFNRKEIQDKDKRLITKWEGKIKNVAELIILTPPGVVIPNIGECEKEKFKDGKCPCNRPFKTYKVGDCEDSCKKQVKEPCDNSCTTKDSAGTIKTDENCIKECDSTAKKCNKECTFLFTPDPGEGSADQKYNAYALDVEAITYRDEYKDIDKFKTFLCRIEPKPEVLGNSPITTRYFRVRARYNYLLENSVKITVEQAPTPLADTIPFEDIDVAPFIKSRPAPELYAGYPSNTDIDKYFKSKNSDLTGIGQCIKDVEQQTKVPATVILAVANLESRDFRPEKLSGLAKLNYNLFGIKCSEYYRNVLCTFGDRKQCCKGYSKTSLDITYEPNASNVYRAYPNYCESVKDFANLISTSDRYKSSMDFVSNPQEMVKRIGKAGYATDPAWPGKVIARMSIIEEEIKKSSSVVT